MSALHLTTEVRLNSLNENKQKNKMIIQRKELITVFILFLFFLETKDPRKLYIYIYIYIAKNIGILSQYNLYPVLNYLHNADINIPAVTTSNSNIGGGVVVDDDDINFITLLLLVLLFLL